MPFSNEIYFAVTFNKKSEFSETIIDKPVVAMRDHWLQFFYGFLCRVIEQTEILDLKLSFFNACTLSACVTGIICVAKPNSTQRSLAKCANANSAYKNDNLSWFYLMTLKFHIFYKRMLIISFEHFARALIFFLQPNLNIASDPLFVYASFTCRKVGMPSWSTGYHWCLSRGRPDVYPHVRRISFLIILFLSAKLHCIYDPDL